MDRDFGVGQQFAEAVDHETLVGFVQIFGVIDEKHNRRRSDAGLRGVIDSGLAAAGGAGVFFLQNLSYDSIQLAGC